MCLVILFLLPLVIFVRRQDTSSPLEKCLYQCDTCCNNEESRCSDSDKISLGECYTRKADCYIKCINKYSDTVPKVCGKCR